MPFGCATWPAFWTYGDNWPNQGEIDIIENVHNANSNLQTLHTNEGCNEASESKSLFSGDWSNGNTNCNVYETGNSGCGIVGPENSYGDSFNQRNGGMYAMEWTSDFIRIFFFPRGSIPSDISTGQPNPSQWGTPVGYWTLNDSICSAGHFRAHKVTFDITFCGDWAGNTFTQSCPNESKGGQVSCVDYVQSNPSEFAQTYWLINSLQVFRSSSSTSK